MSTSSFTDDSEGLRMVDVEDMVEVSYLMVVWKPLAETKLSFSFVGGIFPST
uniref:Uncharacterized protein n=1 Tax=Parascaris equorum TaxID=6256 RepID=A0A914RL10_PAREQ